MAVTKTLRESKKAFRARMEDYGTWGDAIRFRESARQRIADEHLDWDYKTVSKEAWSGMMAAFPMVDPVSGVAVPAVVVRSVPACSGVVSRKTVAEVDRGRRDHPSVSELRIASQVEKSIPTGAKAELLSRALSLDDRGGVQEDTEWCYQNLDIPWCDIDVGTVPSPGAVALLAQAKIDQKWFLSTYHAKLLPSRSKFESEGWFETDDNRVREMSDSVREELRLMSTVDV